MSPGNFKFIKTDHIGAASAEQDHEFLKRCFINTGELEVIENMKDHRQILLGRAGSGKTALIQQLVWNHGEKVIKIEPENLALTYISNSTILQFFSELGVNLDPFFKLLWRHVLTIEILNRHFSLNEPIAKKNSLINRLKNMFSGNSRSDKQISDAIEYLQEWGESFWEETEFRVKEISKRLENSLNAEIAAQLKIPTSNVKSAIRGDEKITEEQKAQLIKKGQDIVSKAQVQDLTKVITLLDKVLSNKQKQYFIVIDELDENWVEEKLRYRLIMALIQTSRDFYKVKNAKVIIAIRRDLIERVFKLTRESGFQEEKFQSLYIPLTWDADNLINLLDQRVGYLVSRRYTKKPVLHKDLLPKNYKKKPITEYIKKITSRPRDIISLFNFCILAGTNTTKLKSPEFKQAEGEYSRSRLRALGDEWNASFPALLKFIKIFQRKSPSFKISNIDDKEIENLVLTICAKNPGGRGILQQKAMNVVDTVITPSDFKIYLMQIYFRVGLVGLKTKSYESEFWVNELGRSLATAEVDLDTSVIVHPMYYRSLGIDQSKIKY